MSESYQKPCFIAWSMIVAIHWRVCGLVNFKSSLVIKVAYTTLPLIWHLFCFSINIFNRHTCHTWCFNTQCHMCYPIMHIKLTGMDCSISSSVNSPTISSFFCSYLYTYVWLEFKHSCFSSALAFDSIACSSSSPFFIYWYNVRGFSCFISCVSLSKRIEF